MITDFQRRVYDAVRKIPCGTVLTYGEVARRIGCGSARAVGQALRVNPYAPQVPCHRVIAADGSLTGFCGQRKAAALAKKRRLLESEGVRFRADGKVKNVTLARETVKTSVCGFEKCKAQGVRETPGAQEENVGKIAKASDVVITSYGVAASRLAAFAPIA